MKEKDKKILKPQVAEPLDSSFYYRISAPYHYRNRYNDRIAEFDIDYYKDSQIKDLVAFLRLYKDRMVNITFKDNIDKEVLETLVTICDNFRLRLSVTDIPIVKELNKNHVKWFFDKDMVITNLSLLESVINMGANAVYVGDDLAYNMENVHAMCEESGVEVRCILNKVPSVAFDKHTNLKSIVFDPRAIDEYAAFYDCFEFDLGPTPIDWHKWGVLFETFFAVRGWHGNLQEINEDIDFEYYPDKILTDFPAYRMTCGKRCLGRKTNNCNRCGRIIGDLQQTFIEKQLNIKAHS